MVRPFPICDGAITNRIHECLCAFAPHENAEPLRPRRRAPDGALSGPLARRVVLENNTFEGMGESDVKALPARM